MTRCFILGLLLLSVVGYSTPTQSANQGATTRTLTQNRQTRFNGVATIPKAVANVGNHKMAFDLNTYKWHNRILFVFAPTEENSTLQRQLQLFEGQQAGFKERDLVLVKLLTDGKSYVEAQALDEAEVAKLRSRFNVAPEEFRVILVGKDGTVKRRESTPIEAKDIFNQIDAMPMRQQEMRDRGNG